MPPSFILYMRKDIVIPCHERHAKLLPECIKGIKENITDELGEIYVTIPDNGVFPDLPGITYVPEDEWSCLNNSEIEEYWNMGTTIRPPRVGWIKQQFIKLNGFLRDELSDDFITVDADHYLLRPHVFEEGGKYIYYTRNLYMSWFEKCAEAIIRGIEPSYSIEPRWSPITEKMMFNKGIMKSMTEEIEAAWHKPLWQLAIDCCIGDGYVMFSEFTLYNDYGKLRFPDRFVEKKEAFYASHILPVEQMSYESVKGIFGNSDSVSFF